MPVRDAQARLPLNDPATQTLVFACEQLLGEIVTTRVSVTTRPGKVVIDP